MKKNQINFSSGKLTAVPNFIYKDPLKKCFSFEFDNAFVRWLVNWFTRLLGPNYWVQDVDYDKYSLVVSCEK